MKKHYITLDIPYLNNLYLIITCTIVLITFSFSVSAQGSLSASAKSAIYTIKKFQQVQRSKNITVTPQVQKELNIFTRNKVQYVGALVKVDQDNIDMTNLHNLGIIVNTKAGDIWSVQIPIEAFENITQVKGIKAVDVGGKMKLFLDKARKDTKADEVHDGINLSKAYLGENVVVGIIDIGFDYTHPTFYDADTKKCRISRVWNQGYVEGQADIGLLPPPGFNYGIEIINPYDIIKKINTNEYKDETKKFYLSDGTGDTHGTHVAGIATGSGLGTSGKYGGIAPKAEIVMVTIKDGTWVSSEILDAMQYIYNYAASVNKPAVINLSAGTYVGPHDGTSLQCQGINNLTGEGKIMVGSAGNDGGSNTHLSHYLGNKNVVFTLVGTYFGEELYTNLSHELIDCWASPATDFSAKVIVHNNNHKIGETKFVPASFNEVVTDTIYEGTDTAFVKMTAEALNPNNNRPNIQIEINTSKYSTTLSFELAFTGNNTTMHAWAGSGFISTGQPNYIAGDDLYSICDGQTAKNIVTAGAYVTMNKYVNLKNEEQSYEKDMQIGNILPISSKGPTLDGLTKPDITAPGFIISSISSLQGDFDDQIWSKSEAYSLISPINGRVYKYAAEYGTSMASPMVAGAVALILEANPKLNPQQVLDILKKTARKDEFTGDIPLTGNTTWGWGKLDILAAVKSTETNTKMFKEPNKVKVSVPFIYPNPATNTITITLPEKVNNKNCSYYISDEFGKQLMSNKIPYSLFSIPIHHLPKGVYLITITDNNATFTNKFIKQ